MCGRSAQRAPGGQALSLTMNSTASLRHSADLLQEGHHVEIMAALLDLVASEIQYPGGRRSLALAGSRDGPARSLQRPGLGPLPGHLEHDLIAALERARHLTLDIRHGLLPAFERTEDRVATLEPPLSADLVVDAVGRQGRHVTLPIAVVERVNDVPRSLDEVRHDVSSFWWVAMVKLSVAYPAPG